MKVRYELRALQRANVHESIEQAHQRIFAPLAAQDGPWKLREMPPTPKIVGGDICANCDLRSYLPGTAKGYVEYQFRGGPADSIRFADSLEMDFTPDVYNYGPLLTDTIPLLIRSMRPYSVHLGDERFRDAVISADGVCQFGAERACGGTLSPVFFLSARALVEMYQVELEDAVSKLTPLAEQVTRLEDGVYVIGSSRILDIVEAIDLAHRLEAALELSRVGFFPWLLGKLGFAKGSKFMKTTT